MKGIFIQFYNTKKTIKMKINTLIITLTCLAAFSVQDDTSCILGLEKLSITSALKAADVISEHLVLNKLGAVKDFINTYKAIAHNSCGGITFKDITAIIAKSKVHENIKQCLLAVNSAAIISEKLLDDIKHHHISYKKIGIETYKAYGKVKSTCRHLHSETERRL